MKVNIWSSNSELHKTLKEDAIEADFDLAEAKLIDASSISDFRISVALSNYLAHFTGLGANLTAEAKLRLAFSDDSGQAAKAFMSAAEIAKQNPVSTEQVIFITSSGGDTKVEVGLTAFTQTIKLEKRFTPLAFTDKSGCPHNNVSQISASSVRAFLNFAMHRATGDCMIRYADMLLDPTTNTGVIALAVCYERHSEASSASDHVAITAFIPGKFKLNDNPFMKTAKGLDLITEMNHGLKNKLKMITKISSQADLVCKQEDLISGKSVLKLLLEAKDSHGDILRSDIASIDLENLSDAVIAKIKDRTIIIDSGLMHTAVSVTKGDLQIGISDKLICFISEDSLVATSAVVAKAAEIEPEPVATEIEPEPVTAEPEPVTAEPEPVAAEPELPEASPENNALQDEYANYADPEEAAIEKAASAEADESLVQEYEAVLNKLDDVKSNVEAALSVAEELIASTDFNIEKQEMPVLGKASLQKQAIPSGVTVISITALDVTGDKYVCSLPDHNIVIEIDTAAIMPAAGAAKLIFIKPDSTKHKVLQVFEANKDKTLSLEAVIELGGELVSTMTPASIVSAMAMLHKESLLLKPGRGVYKLNLNGKYTLKK